MVLTLYFNNDIDLPLFFRKVKAIDRNDDLNCNIFISVTISQNVVSIILFKYILEFDVTHCVVVENIMRLTDSYYQSNLFFYRFTLLMYCFISIKFLLFYKNETKVKCINFSQKYNDIRTPSEENLHCSFTSVNMRTIFI